MEELAWARGLPIESWIIDDGVSGTKEPEKRKLGKLLKRIKSGDVIICSELSRLGRRLFMVISILEHCMKIGAKVLTVKDGYELGDNVQSKILVAEVERDMISKRTKEALQRRKINGGKLGRPFGSVNRRHVLDGKEAQIRAELANGATVAEITKKHKVGKSTVYRFISQENLR